MTQISTEELIVRAYALLETFNDQNKNVKKRKTYVPVVNSKNIVKFDLQRRRLKTPEKYGKYNGTIVNLDPHIYRCMDAAEHWFNIEFGEYGIKLTDIYGDDCRFKTRGSQESHIR